MDLEASSMTTRLPTHIDRYPAKMVSRLADRLVARYAPKATAVLDPFCGSGAALLAAQKRGIPTTGVDINPIAEMFSRVKLRGFSRHRAAYLADELIRVAQSRVLPFPIQWDAKDYWFTPSTLTKLERLRAAAVELNLASTQDGVAVLLSMSLSVRLCSKADQRSPKPFISKIARESRRGKHFDPYGVLVSILDELSDAHSETAGRAASNFLRADLSADQSAAKGIGRHSHVITSPPYINAQDYFRNFKLELYVLEGVLPFSVDHLRERFIGTERGELLAGLASELIVGNLKAVPELRSLTQSSPRLAAVVHRYLYEMGRAFDTISRCLDPNGVFVLVCGDNLVGGFRIRTWRVLKTMLERKGFVLFDSFSDPIQNRMLAPKRSGHKGLIKEEVVCAFSFGKARPGEPLLNRTSTATSRR
jgi:SAM-dependent methyltransferase